MSQQIRRATPGDYIRIMEIWDQAVTATHNFLFEENFIYFKQIIPKNYLPHLDVFLLIEQGEQIGFASASKGNLEILFIHSEYHGKVIENHDIFQC